MRRFFWLLSALLCACTGTLGPIGTLGPAPPGHLSVQATPAEDKMLADLSSHRAGTDLLTAALIIGGPDAPTELETTRRALAAAIEARVQSLPRSDPATRARALLASLFAGDGDRPLLVRYEASTTTLFEVVTSGRYNCVSATTLFILAAERAGIDARPVLLPSHARAVVIASGRRFVVETTTPRGFDPPESVSREALARARPRGPNPRIDLYADEKGTEVDDSALLAVTYGNLGIMAEDRGDKALAAALLSREATLTPAAQAPIVRMQQASLLSELATRAYEGKKFDDALGLARRAEAAAPEGPDKRLAEQNIAAIATGQLFDVAPGMDEGGLARFADSYASYPNAYGDIRATSYTLLAERRLKRGDVDGSSAALREAARVATSDTVRGAAGHNARLGELNLLAKKSMTDPEGAWSDFTRLSPPDPAVAAQQAQAGGVIATNRAVGFSNAGQCKELEGVLAGGLSIDGASGLRAGCHEKHALSLADQNDLPGAITEMRESFRLEPNDPRHKKNLTVLLQKQIDALVRSSRCDAIGPMMTEGRALAPGDTFWAEVSAFCAPR